MKTELKEIYKCDHCNKLYQIKSCAIAHELICSKNPTNHRPCFICAHLEKKETIYYYDTYCGENKKTINLLHCAVIDSFLYPPKVESKKNWFDLGDKHNEPMPKECDKQEYVI